MLREEQVRQNPGEPRRRWFADDYFDLILWEAEGGFGQMQLCYNRGHDEHALVWRLAEGFAHVRVDEGEFGNLKKASPMMVTDGPLDGARLQREFGLRSGAMETSLREWVLEKISEYCEQQEK